VVRDDGLGRQAGHRHQQQRECGRLLKRYGKKVSTLLLVSVILVNLVTIAADLQAGAAGIGILAGAGSRWIIVPLGLDAVTGRRRYASDYEIPNMRYGAVLRPPVRGAALRAVEVGAAEQMPGVEVVRDGEFVGVTAPDLVTARRAVAAIRADWDSPAPIDGPMPGYLRAHPVAGKGWQQPATTAAARSAPPWPARPRSCSPATPPPIRPADGRDRHPRGPRERRTHRRVGPAEHQRRPAGYGFPL
jgi:hypothetical protein